MRVERTAEWKNEGRIGVLLAIKSDRKHSNEAEAEAENGRKKEREVVIAAKNLSRNPHALITESIK